jgi:hypothetical protein
MTTGATWCFCARTFIPPGAVSIELGGVLHWADGPCYHVDENYRQGVLGNHHFVPQDSPQVVDSANLGLATTEELLRELIARERGSNSIAFVYTERAVLLAEILGGMSRIEREYRTIDGG